MKTQFISVSSNLQFAIDQTIKILKNNGIFVFPTDTVYGIGCSQSSKVAVEKIYKIKGRDFNKPLGVYFSDIDMASKYISGNVSLFKKLADTYLPGELTIIAPKNELIANYVVSNFDTIGIRIPRNTFLLELINQLGQPIVGTSANLSNLPSAKTAKEAYTIFENQIELIIEDDASIQGTESTIVSITNGKVELIRQGILNINNELL